MGASTEVVELIRAAQNGDPWARDRVIATHLPLVYNLLGRALNGHREVDDLVRQTMLRALDGLDGREGREGLGGPGGPGGPRDPGGFRPWLLALALHAVREHAQRSSLTGADGLPAAQGPDFAELTVERLRLSGRSREAAEAARWIEPEDSALLALWWLECGGRIGRHEVATALRWSVEHTAARWEGIRLRFEAARVVVAVLAADPPCQGLRYEAATWDGHPSAPWREHLAWHIRGCVRCAACCDGLIPIEALVAGLPLVPPPTHLLADVHGPRAYDPAGRQEPVERRTVPAAPAPAATGPALTPARTAQGPRSSRSTRRRRRQERERGRRRVIVTTGLAVMALAGGSFYLSPGRGGGGDGLNRAAAPAPDLPSGAHEPAGLTPAPSTSSGPASATASASPATPATPSLAARTKAATTSARPAPTATTAPAKTTAPRTSAPEPAPTRTGTGGGTGGGSDTGTGAGGGTGAGSQGGSGEGSVADQVISLVNAERAKAGCGPLAANATLTGAAQGHSDDMAARDFFDHINPDGEGPGERVTEAGYPWSTYGENIAKGQSTPEQVMEAWMNSPGHRANILNCDFKEIGIGVHTEGGPYWTQVFGAR